MQFIGILVYYVIFGSNSGRVQKKKEPTRLGSGPKVGPESSSRVQKLDPKPDPTVSLFKNAWLEINEYAKKILIVLKVDQTINEKHEKMKTIWKTKIKWKKKTKLSATSIDSKRKKFKKWKMFWIIAHDYIIKKKKKKRKKKEKQRKKNRSTKSTMKIIKITHSRKRKKIKRKLFSRQKLIVENVNKKL